MKRSFLTFALCCSVVASAFAADPFVGTFSLSGAGVIAQIKPVDSGYQGVLQSAEGLFAFDATRVSETRIAGTVFGGTPVAFSAQKSLIGLTVESEGQRYEYTRISSEHQLADVDLTPYLKPAGASAASGDYDYSYTQADPGLASERMTRPGQTGAAPTTAGGLNDPGLRSQIAGSQLVYYQRTSYLNDSNASSITYVNFCPNGSFSVTYEGSFSVEGSYGGNAQGANHGQRSGNWQLTGSSASPKLLMAYGNGAVETYPIDRNRLHQGRWRTGNTQYAIQRGGAICR